MSRRSRIEALRRLAERPGTPAEGEVARRMLERAEASAPDRHESFRSFLRTGNMDDLAAAVGPTRCSCGMSVRPFTVCAYADDHFRIAAEIKQRFPRGTRVYYNYWAYAENCPATVVGYPREGMSFSWIRLKFDHLKTVRAAPIYDTQGWHLSTEPLERDAIRKAGLRGPMYQWEDKPDV